MMPCLQKLDLSHRHFCFCVWLGFFAIRTDMNSIPFHSHRLYNFEYIFRVNFSGFCIFRFSHGYEITVAMAMCWHILTPKIRVELKLKRAKKRKNDYTRRLKGARIFLFKKINNILAQRNSAHSSKMNSLENCFFFFFKPLTFNEINFDSLYSLILLDTSLYSLIFLFVLHIQSF